MEQEQTIKVKRTSAIFHFSKPTGFGEEVCAIALTIDYSTKRFSIKPIGGRVMDHAFGFIDGYGIKSALRWKTIAELIAEAADFAKKDTEIDNEELPF